MAIDQSIKDIIQPVLERSVTNTLETTRELVLKDFIVENEEDKLN
jgi:CCR4-NOT transcription complex subunit 1